MMGMNTRIGICLLAVAVYYNTLDAGFVYDDSVAVLSNPDVLATRPLGELWQHDFWGTSLGSSSSHGSYRPLCVLSYRLTHQACGFRPACYHLLNVLLHGLASVLVHKAACLFLPGRAAPTVAGLLFAVHPVHTEAVAGVVGRADLLSCVFFLLSLLTYVEHARIRDAQAAPSAPKRRPRSPEPLQPAGLLPDWIYLASSVVLAACATLCKETGITVLAVSALYDLFIHRQLNIFKAERGVRNSVSLALGAGVVLAGLRLHMMGLSPPSFSSSDNPAARSSSLLTRTLTFLYLPVLNLWLLVYPRWLSFDWSMEAVPRVQSLWDPRNLASLLLYSGLAASARRLARPRQPPQVLHTRDCRTANNNNQVRCRCPSRPDRSQALLLSLSLLVLPFVPASNLVFYVGFVIAERVLYLPSVGYCFLVGLGYSVVSRSLGPRASRSALFLLLLSYASKTYHRNYDWVDDESLYRSGIPINPPKAYGNLGSILNSQGRLDEAEIAYRTALKYRPNMAEVHYNLGVLLQGRQRSEEATRSYQLAVKYRPSLAVAYLNLGTLLEKRGRWKEAEAVLLRCISLDWRGVRDPRTHQNTRVSAMVQLGRMYADRTDYHRAIRVYSEAVTMRPHNYQPQVLYNLLGESLSKLNRHEEAERWFKASLEAKPDHVPAHITYGKHLAKNRTRLSEAEEWFRRAQKLAPADASVYLHFGQFLEEVGRHCEAAMVYKKAVDLAPEQYEGVEGAATALRRAGRKVEAESYYRRAVRLRPQDASSHSNLGAILHINGKMQEAAMEYQEALRLEPGDATTLANLRKLRSLERAEPGRPTT